MPKPIVNDLAALRMRFAPGRGERPGGNPVLTLCDEVERLRAEKAQLVTACAAPDGGDPLGEHKVSILRNGARGCRIAQRLVGRVHALAQFLARHVQTLRRPPRRLDRRCLLLCLSCRNVMETFEFLCRTREVMDAAWRALP